MFEAADRDLEGLWLSKEWQAAKSLTVNYSTISRWVAQQCLGITNDLRKLHVLHGIHGNIAPENILHFGSWDYHAVSDPYTVHEQLRVLQLSGFGASSLDSTPSQVKRYIRFRNYLAPEMEIIPSTQTTLTDVWNLGCLFLDFVTWMVDGPKGYEKFAEDRLSPALRGEHCGFATISQAGNSEGPGTTAKVNERVLQVSVTLTVIATPLTVENNSKPPTSAHTLSAPILYESFATLQSTTCS